MQDLGVAQAIHPHTLLIQGHTDTPGAGGGVNAADLAITRLFHRIDLILPEQLHQQIIKKVCSRAYKNILRICLHTTELGQMAAVMLGSTETTLYTAAVYFGSVGVSRTRYAVPAALCADVAGFLTAAWMVRLLF